MDAIEGTGSVRLNVAATGSKVGEIKQGLDGTASVTVTDGALLGVDVWQLLQQGRAALTGPDAPPAAANPRTPFSRIAVSGPVEDALLTTSEFSAAMPFATITGQGTLALLTTELDIRAQAGLIDGEILRQDPVLARAAGFNFPIRITGTLDAPSVLPDFSGLAGMLGQAVRQRASEEADAAREEAEAEVQEEIDEARDELEDSLRDRLRDRLD
jgi:AsmA protein